jgi:2-hydroxy-3-oxopropionate reductase
MHIGAVGMASLAKLATNLLVALHTAALAEALVLAAKGGLDLARRLNALANSAADLRLMEVRAADGRGRLPASDEA